MTIQPDQLPNKVSNFIAYGAEERAADPTNDGEVITIRPQVYVRFYPGLVVSELKTGGRSGQRDGLVTVHFDPASVGFKEAISAHMNDDDQTLWMLQNSLENKAPLTVAIETQRKKKNSETGSPISPLTPIHALRGASQPNGDGDGKMMMGPSGNNTSNRLAFVNGVSTQHIQSDPTEWKSLVNNKAGDLPPEGWRNFAPGEDWREIGAAVRVGAPLANLPQAGNLPAGSFPAPDELAALIQNVVSQTIQGLAPTLANHLAQASAPSGPQGRPSGKFDEGRQWHPRTSDGRINLGGYVVAGERWVFEWAFRYLTEDLGVQATVEDAWGLAERIFAMASQVQSNAYGHGFVADRATPSHREAEHWVQWTVKNLHAFPGLDADEDTLTAWTEEVVPEASTLLSTAGSHAGAYFDSVSKRDKNGAAPQSKKAEETPSGPSEKVIRAFLDVVQKGWDNLETIRNLGRQGRDNGYLDEVVSMAPAEDGGVSISYPPAEGQESGPLGSLLIYRLEGLKAQQGNTQQDSGNATSEGTQAQDQGGAQAQQASAPQGQNPQGQAPSQPSANEGQASVPQADSHVASIIERLKAVTDDQALRAVFEEVRDANLVAAQAFVAQGANGEVLFGQEGQEGYQAQSLGNIIGVMRQSFITPAPQETEQANEAPAEAESAPEQEQTPEATESAPEPEATETPAPETQQDSAPEAEPDSTPEAPASEPETAPAEKPSPEAEQGDSSEAQRLADAARTASTPDEIAALKAEAEEKGLSGNTIMVGDTEGVLSLWITHQERRVNRANRAQG